MNIDDLADEEGEIPRFKDEAPENLSEMTARQLAYYFKTGSESQKIVYMEFVNTQPKEYQTEFNEALQDPTLGESDDDIYDEDGAY